MSGPGPGAGSAPAARRREYERGALHEADVGAGLGGQALRDPLEVVRTWLDDADAAGDPEPTAMALATSDADGPDARVVLCKGIDHGVVWFTNHRSAKGQQLMADPRAAVLFHWPLLERQVRLRGSSARLTAGEDDAYFASRPRASQLGAWASGHQSAPVDDRATLEDDLAAARERFEGGPVPRPPWWGGWRLVPDVVELWQGRPGRLHDRLLLTREDGPTWRLDRLRP